MDKIFIKDLRVRAILGVRDWERETVQDILINVIVFTDTRSAALSDSLEDCVDYSQLVKDIRAAVMAARRYTVEALSEDIARLCLSRKGVSRVIVRVEKPAAVSEAASAGIEIERP